MFGDGEFAVRLSAPLLHGIAAGFVYAIGTRLYDRRIGFWSALAYASLPAVSLSALLMSTDAVLMPCWAAGLYCFIRAREDGDWRWWLATGAAIGLGLLAKYAMAYWLISAFCFVLLRNDERRHLRGLLLALAVGLLVVAPNLWWNANHGFVSILHVRDNAQFGGSLFHPAAFVKFVISQFGVFGPIMLAGLLVLCIRPIRLLRGAGADTWLVYLADAADRAGCQSVVAGRAELGGAGLCLGSCAGHWHRADTRLAPDPCGLDRVTPRCRARRFRRQRGARHIGHRCSRPI